MPDQFDNIQGNATGGAGEGEPALPVGDIQDYMEGAIASFANFVTSPDDIPETATGRPNGIFTSDFDIAQYLSEGGLVGWEMTSPDVWEMRPIGWVYVLQVIDEDTGEVEYQVWIDEDTNGGA